MSIWGSFVEQGSGGRLLSPPGVVGPPESRASRLPGGQLQERGDSALTWALPGSLQPPVESHELEETMVRHSQPVKQQV